MHVFVSFELDDRLSMPVLCIQYSAHWFTHGSFCLFALRPDLSLGGKPPQT